MDDHSVKGATEYTKTQTPTYMTCKSTLAQTNPLCLQNPPIEDYPDDEKEVECGKTDEVGPQGSRF
jgi:hypothetical protein